MPTPLFIISALPAAPGILHNEIRRWHEDAAGRCICTIAGPACIVHASRVDVSAQVQALRDGIE